MKSISSCPIYGNTENPCTRDSTCPQNRLVTVKRRKGDYASFSVLFNSLLNTFVITSVTKCSMKPQSGTTAIVTSGGSRIFERGFSFSLTKTPAQFELKSKKKGHHPSYFSLSSLLLDDF